MEELNKPRMITFYGQTKIVQELLTTLIPGMQKGYNTNLLFRAPSGYGKTTLAGITVHKLCNSDPSQYHYTLPDNEGLVTLDLTKRIIWIDEAHLMTKPEDLYPYMDTRQHIFLICTNFAGTLPEALKRRCIPLVFSEYTDQERVTIIKDWFSKRDAKVSDEVAWEINKNVSTPGEIVILCERLLLFFSVHGKLASAKEVREYIVGTLDIIDGLTPEHRRYIELLKQQGGRLSLNAIANTLGIDKYSLMSDIEPRLIQKGLIRITPKGRELATKLEDLL